MCMQALVIGSGSIGERHARNLSTYFNAEVCVASRNPEKPFRSEILNNSTSVSKKSFESIQPTCWDVCVIATPSSLRKDAILPFSSHSISSLYVEVPAVVNESELSLLLSLPLLANTYIHAGYNMRYHPAWKHIKSRIISTEIPSAFRAIFAEHLPSIHSWEDYRKRYEAVRELGGGPLLTSQHELDMAINLLGRVTRVSCIQMNTVLNIDSADHSLITLFHLSGAVSTIDLNFFYKKYTRTATLATDKDVYTVEPFDRGIVSCSDVQNYSDYDFNQTYIESMKFCLQRKPSQYCLSKDDLQHLVKVTDRCEESAVSHGKILKI